MGGPKAEERRGGGGEEEEGEEKGESFGSWIPSFWFDRFIRIFEDCCDMS